MDCSRLPPTLSRTFCFAPFFSIGGGYFDLFESSAALDAPGQRVGIRAAHMRQQLHSKLTRISFVSKALAKGNKKS
jgi:hypothetical protein